MPKRSITSGCGPGGYVRTGHHVVVGNKKPLSENFNPSRRSELLRPSPRYDEKYRKFMHELNS